MICIIARILSFILLIIVAFRIAASEADDYSEGSGKDESEQGEDKR